MKADLHLHTTASDGVVSPERLLELVREAGVSAFAVTDHDTVAAVPVIAPLADEAGLLFIPGIEINTYWNGDEYHILGYHLDWRNPGLNAALREIRDHRSQRMRRMVVQLQGMGLAVSWEEVLEVARGESLCRPHLAVVLARKGLATGIDDAFKRYLIKGRPGYVSRKSLRPEEAVDLIHQAGGTAVLAHPGRIKEGLSIERLRQLGVDGLEAFHPDHDEATARSVRSLAEEAGLLVTGGSDFHGYDRRDGNGKGRMVGSQPVPLRLAEALASRKGARGGT